MDGLLLLCVTGAAKYEARLEVQHVKISKLVVFCVSSTQGHNISRSGRLHIYPSTQPKAKGNFTHVMATLQMARQQLNDAIKALVLNVMQLYNHLCTWVMLTDAKSAFMFSRLVDNWNPHIDECSCYPEFQYRAFNKLFSKNCNYVG